MYLDKEKLSSLGIVAHTGSDGTPEAEQDFHESQTSLENKVRPYIKNQEGQGWGQESRSLELSH